MGGHNARRRQPRRHRCREVEADESWRRVCVELLAREAAAVRPASRRERMNADTAVCFLNALLKPDGSGITRRVLGSECFGTSETRACYRPRAWGGVTAVVVGAMRTAPEVQEGRKQWQGGNGVAGGNGR